MSKQSMLAVQAPCIYISIHLMLRLMYEAIVWRSVTREEVYIPEPVKAKEILKSILVFDSPLTPRHAPNF